MTELIEPGLWAVTLPAIRAARARGLQYVESGKYVPRVKVTEYQENDQGWSTTTSRDLFPGNTSPIEWTSLIGIRSGQDTPIGLDEVPELSDAADWVVERSKGDQRFMERVTLRARMQQTDIRRDEVTRADYVRWFVGSLIGRIEAVGATQDREIEAVYAEFERARFADTLIGDLVVPVALTPFALDGPFRVADGVWIEPLDQLFQRARATSLMWGGRVSALVIAAASHAVVIRDVRIDNSDLFHRRWVQDAIPEMARADLALQAIHIATGLETGYAQVVVRPRDWADEWTHDLPPVWKLAQIRNYPDSFDNAGWLNPKQCVDASRLENLPVIFASLEASPANVRLAARRSFRALLRDDDEDRTLDATIGIEALLLANGEREEVTYRMALRAAVALSSEGANPETVVRALKDVYTHRSRIVHGRLRKGDDVLLGDSRYPAREVATLLLRELLKAHLTADPPWSPEALDRRMLNGLATRSDAHTGSTEVNLHAATD